jgi:putative aldouronate transport system permease protein
MYELEKVGRAKTAPRGSILERSRIWRRIRAQYDRDGALFLLALPALLHIFIFYYVTLPFLVIAFKHFRAADGVWGSRWVGFQNFEFLFGGTGIGWRIVTNVVLYNTTFIVLGTILSLTVAILLAEVHRSVASRFYRTALFFPQFVSWVIIAYIALAFLHRDHGLVNAVLAALGREPVNWYATPWAWPVILVITNVWRTLGIGAIIYLAGILRINPEYYEAAAVDGANRWQQIRYITLPSLTPLIIILVLLSLGQILRGDFGLFYQIPRQYLHPELIRTTDIIDTYVLRALRQGGQLELAMAASVYQATVGFALVVLVNWIVRRVDPERALF